MGKGKMFIGNGDDFTPIADVSQFSTETQSEQSAKWPTDGDLSISLQMTMTPKERRNFLVWWIIFSALATARRILD
ncbi:hypothetical protein [Mesorhizobium sp. M1B.F.Ca.ET.045.04.1.1]|uniref:hypothetical protein n=1 Tax=Mesorhizobium sp. M1B.F.Ca.ET.045.04.1.1 TaxID=2493673 RepID=UPI000F74D353|nr:hypothetical protein [Mesorhizobium sp. M1B.F.Ca.ET.045.04.1.1]AZO29400.1 hypothetical protein EJ071_19735 [Mesorhizobium sp. M1B.F.Ca.ET.045.04.1.1]